MKEEKRRLNPTTILLGNEEYRCGNRAICVVRDNDPGSSSQYKIEVCYLRRDNCGYIWVSPKRNEKGTQIPFYPNSYYFKDTLENRRLLREWINQRSNVRKPEDL